MVSSTFGFDERPEGLRLGDMNGDGLLDGIVVGQVSSYLLINTGDGFFIEADRLGGGATGVEIADLNGDDRLDVILSGNAQQEILFNNDFGFLTPSDQRLPEAADAPIVGDFDSDGDIDLIFAEMLWLNGEAMVGEASRNGELNFADFLMLASNFGPNGRHPRRRRFDGDGTIGFADLPCWPKTLAQAAAAALLPSRR